ncbi:MAG: M1 family metallopeptidase [Clostridia bacterium]|nr:M1 family metallopeptidase [Clostridia bacterium]
MKKFFVILFSCVLIFSVTGCKKKDNLDELSANLTCYEINLNVDVDTMTATASQTVAYINNTQSILKTIKFHLYPQFFEEGATDSVVASTKMNNAYPNGMSYAEFNIDRVQVEGTDKTIVYECDFDSILSVELNSSLMPDETTEIYIEYSFTLPNCCHRFGYGENTINLANFYPIVCVFENDEFNTNGYNSNGDPFYSDMANYCVDITINSQYLVAGTGNKINEKIENGEKNISFEAKLVRDFALVASDNFQVLNEEFDGVNIEYYYFNDIHPENSLKAGVDAIKTFSDLFGTYPYSTFSIVECDFVYGGMEYPNLVMISTDIEYEDDYLNVIIHETAHQWWYGIVGNNEYNFPWLDEALTEFSTILFYDKNEGYNFSHSQMVNSCKENYTLFISVYEDVLGTIDTSMRAVDKYSTEPEYTYCTYVKGVLMYESLYQLIGEKNFYKCLKTYFEDNKFKNATPDDLINSFENASNQNLKNFFESWINGKVVIR